ncbi:PREDICTED: max-binding protein MNT [Gekko japonicus]|uniref:Max-binding protein MNT n=1 Tax=Gekko japonicus TaxID=146911 RepID=A0ABM1KUL0_GEKJA|nr:PREDICTED: max-binding protein MNT [Gekko japonicus]
MLGLDPLNVLRWAPERHLQPPGGDIHSPHPNSQKCPPAQQKRGTLKRAKGLEEGEENEKHEKLRLEHEQEQKKASVQRVNHAVHLEEPRNELPAVPLSPPVPAPPPPPPPPLAAPISVIPLPVVASPPQQAVQSALSPPLIPHHQPLVAPPGLGQEAALVAPVIQRTSGPLLPDIKAPTPPSGSPKQLPHYAAPVLAISQHHVVQHPIQPQPPLPLQQQQQHPVAPQPLGALKLAPSEDGKPSEQKKRPGGVGTREVHNKLEKNRRAHLKECFETLKRNIPNIDDKKTSNLSVLRSALRYIQTLKRKEKEYEHEMERLAREKIATQQRLEELKNELSQRMDITEIERIIRQMVQPEDDQASTSTASEGEDNIDEDMEDDRPVNSLPKLAHRQHSELLKPLPPNAASYHPSVLPLPQKHTPPHTQPPLQPQALVPPQAIVPAQTHLVAASTVQSTVIAHTATTHASVIQTVNHVIQGPQPKHIAHIAPSTSSPVQLTTTAQPIGHITVHPATLNHVAHLGQQLPVYPQPVAVSQPVVGHIAHTISHQQVNGTTSLGQPAVMAKPTVGTQVVHHQQLVGQTVLNPLTMVTMPSFPVSTLKLA